MCTTHFRTNKPLQHRGASNVNIAESNKKQLYTSLVEEPPSASH